MVAAKNAGVRMFIITSDNFNKYPLREELLRAMIEEQINIPFFIQADTQIVKQPDFIELLAEAGCIQVFVGIESLNRKTLLSVSKAQNHPETYPEMLRLFRQFGITSHFSNIIGFPDDTTSSVEEHLAGLLALNPDVASFYPFTPIPGTDDYDKMLAAGLITAKSLDGLDATRSAWKHPNMEPYEIRRLLYKCYRVFNSMHRLRQNLTFCFKRRRKIEQFMASAGFTVLGKINALQGRHPMSGGFWRVRLDKAADYRLLRQKMFGVDDVPFPKSLALPAKDQETNRKAKLVIA